MLASALYKSHSILWTFHFPSFSDNQTFMIYWPLMRSQNLKDHVLELRGLFKMFFWRLIDCSVSFILHRNRLWFGLDYIGHWNEWRNDSIAARVKNKHRVDTNNTQNTQYTIHTIHKLTHNKHNTHNTHAHTQSHASDLFTDSIWIWLHLHKQQTQARYWIWQSIYLRPKRKSLRQMLVGNVHFAS